VKERATLGQHIVKDVALLVFVAFMAIIANMSALVWGPNMAYLLQRRRPLARSIAYTIGRGLTLTLASLAIVWTLLKTDSGVTGLADQVTSLADKPRPVISVLIGLAVVVVAFWLWKRPPAFLSAKKPSVAEDESARIWPAFVMGVTILFANVLEFGWQTIGVGTAVSASSHNPLVYGPAVLLWTTLGTATLWGPALAYALAPGWATQRFERVTDRIPSIKPWQVALPVGLFGLLFAVFGIWKAARG
jgi:hypothetical protein